MNWTYNAFISYRHVQRDIKVAEDIQKQLENYKIPKEISEKTGIKKIDRVFRDKSELPLSSNLTEEIKNALLNSEYLIVVCSPETKESVWIAKEIELFLQTHPQDHVLTVLSAGEPADVIPEVLLRREIAATMEDGRTVITSEQVEPLCGDYRLPLKRVHKEEIPRLAAALIGCKYDDLIQRAARARMKRMRIIASAVAAGSAAAVGYLLWSNHQIKTNLEQSQINMSLYLADQSIQALEDQDRIGAIELALEALPDGNNKKPVMAEAVYALTEALDAYTIPAAGQDYSAVKRYETRYFIKDFLINPDHTRMAAIDREDTLYIWDLTDDTLLLSEKKVSGCSIEQAYEHGFFLRSDYYTSLLDWSDGHVIWEDNKDDYCSLFVYEENDNLFASVYSDTLEAVDLSGNTVYSYSLNLDYFESIDHIKLSRNGDQAVCAVSNADDETDIILVDFTTGKHKLIAEHLNEVDYVSIMDDGNILIAELSNDDYHVSADYSFSDSAFYVFTMNEKIYLYKPSGEQLWNKSIEFYHSGAQFNALEYVDENGQSQTGLLCGLGNLQVLLNTKDGSVHNKTEWPCAIRNIVSLSSDASFSLLEDGTLAVFYYNDNDSGMWGQRLFIDDSVKCLSSRKAGSELEFMVLPRLKPYIIHYKKKVIPEGFESLKNVKAENTFENVCVKNHYIAYSYNDDEYAEHVALYDIDSKKILRSYPTESVDKPEYEFSDDGKSFCLMKLENYDPVVKKINLSDLSEETVQLIGDDKDPWDYDCVLNGSDVRYLYTDYHVDGYFKKRTGEFVLDEDSKTWKLVYGSFDLKKGKAENSDVIWIEDWQEDWEVESWVVSDDGEHCLLDIMKNTDGTDLYELYLVNHLKKDTEMILLDESEYPHYKGTFNQSVTEVALPGDHELRIIDMNGNQIHTIPYKEDSFLSVTYINDELYLLTNETNLSRFDRKKNLMKTYEIGNVENSEYDSDDTYTLMKNGSTLYVLADCRFSNILNILDLNQNQTQAAITDCIGFDNERQKVFVTADAAFFSDSVDIYESTCIGEMPIYTVEQLIQKGRAIVGASSLGTLEKD